MRKVTSGMERRGKCLGIRVLVGRVGGRRGRRAAVLIVATACVCLAAVTATAQDTDEYFKTNCATCHTIGGGPLTGPDLKDVSARQPDRQWLMDFIVDPRRMIDQGGYGTKIFEAAGGKTYMPAGPGITAKRAEKLLDLIDEESKKEVSRFVGVGQKLKPFTSRNRADGYEYFLGRKKFVNGGAACISCHSMYDTPALGGGRLGPDLTNVSERLKGAKSLMAWLGAPQTETMQPIYKAPHELTPDEIHALVAYFEASAGNSPSEAPASRVAFLLMGLVGAGAMVFAMDAVWKRRFRGVRRPLVEGSV